MELNDFFYELDEKYIAQRPLSKRDDSKLLVLKKGSGQVNHCKFSQIVNFLSSGDCLVLNNTRVLNARLFGVNERTGARIEFLLLKNVEKSQWNVLCRPAKRAKIGCCFNFDGKMKCVVLKNLDDGLKLVEFDCFGSDFFDIVKKTGQVPLPPYIKKKLVDVNSYQTIYSKELGSVAAPTAGLHFTENVLEALKKKGVKIGFLTLHVGLGTFRPVKVKNIFDHKMHSESYFLPSKTAALINETKKSGGRVFCVGTTSCRTLESVFLKHGKICFDEGSTSLFIYPGFKFHVVDALLTNFHLPCSTLLMLVSAFAGKDNIFNAYEQAKRNNYRFFSFGDAMLIV